MKKKKKLSDIAITIIIIGVAVAVVGTLAWKIWSLFHDDKNKTTQETVKLTEIDKILNRNLDQRYPETPNAVVKLYASITKELHTKEITEEQITKLFGQLRKLFDEELLAHNGYEDHMKKLNEEIKQYKSNKMYITRYTVEDSDRLKIYTDKEGKDCTKIRITFSIKNDSQWLKSNEQVILRKDEDGRWKILGNEQTDEAVSDKNEE